MFSLQLILFQLLNLIEVVIILLLVTEEAVWFSLRELTLRMCVFLPFIALSSKFNIDIFANGFLLVDYCHISGSTMMNLFCNV